MSFNRNPKLHRQVLGSLLLKNNLLDKGMMSMGYDVDGIHKFDNYVPTDFNRKTPIYSEEKIPVPAICISSIVISKIYIRVYYKL